MSITIDNEVAAMRRMSIGELREKHERVFGETTTTRHAACLIRRIAWREFSISAPVPLNLAALSGTPTAVTITMYLSTSATLSTKNSRRSTAS